MLEWSKPSQGSTIENIPQTPFKEGEKMDHRIHRTIFVKHAAALLFKSFLRSLGGGVFKNAAVKTVQ